MPPAAVRPVRILALPALVLALALSPPLAAAKGLDLSLRSDRADPVVGEPIGITLTGAADEALAQPCSAMRVVVVAPGVAVGRALRSLEGGATSRRIGRWDAFRLASLRPVGELSWRGRLRPDRAGRWTLIVPNWCAAGYVLPGGVRRLDLDVRR